jgi:hypothetical protein
VTSPKIDFTHSVGLLAIILGRRYVAVTPKIYGERTADLAGLGFVHDEKEDRFLAPAVLVTHDRET